MSTDTVTPTIPSGSYLNAIKTTTIPLVIPTRTQLASVSPISIQTAGRRKTTRRKRSYSKKSKSNSK